MRSVTLARRNGLRLLLGIIGLFGVAGVAGGQGTSPSVTVAVPANPPVETWESLYTQHRYVDAEQAVRQWSGASSPVVQYWRGLLAFTFNDPDAAILALRPLVDSLPAVLSVEQLQRATTALGESYRAVYRYREAGDVYRAALQRRRLAPDSALRAAWEQGGITGDQLRDALPQRVLWADDARQEILPNGGARYGALVSVNGEPAEKPLRFDVSVPFTVLDSTTAMRHRIQVLDSTILLSLHGEEKRAHLGIARTFGIGAANISNVIVAMVADGDIPTYDGSDSTDVAGIIGFPVINALRRVTFTLDGHIALSPPGIVPTALSSSEELDNHIPMMRLAFSGDMYGGGLAVSSLNDSAPPAREIGIDPVQEITSVDSSGEREGSFLQARRPITAVAFDFAAMTLVFRHMQPAPVLPTITYPSESHSEKSVTDISNLPEDLAFVALLFTLFVLPKALQRYRIPGAITSLVLGGVASFIGLFHHDPTLHLLSTFGIVALFLFAGLEIDGRELRRNTSALVLYCGIWSLLIAVTAAVAIFGFGMAIRPAMLVALALMTPSTGFILSSLDRFGLQKQEQTAVKTYSVGSELLALGVLFFVLQSTSVKQLLFSLAVMIGVVIIIPLAFRFFAAVVAPHAPRSEFAFLLMVAVVCAYVTRQLGVYYLVGAFLVGVAAQRFRTDHPAMSSEAVIDALELFGSVFIPFYFFRAGTEIDGNQFTPLAIGIGILLLLVCIPVRIGIIALQRRHGLGDSLASAKRISNALVPTLVFTLVIADILRTQYGLSATLTGALVLYTVLNTTVPAFALRSAVPEFETVAATPIAQVTQYDKWYTPQ